MSKIVRLLVAVAAVTVLLGSATAQAAAPAGGTLSKAKRTLSWAGGPFYVSDMAPDPSGLDLYAPSCQTDMFCDHFALKVNLGEGAKVRISITTPRPNPPGAFLGITSLEPVTGDDYDLYVYDPNGALITGAQGATEKGDETVTITHHKKFNGKAYDVAVRPWAVLPGSTYSGAINALSLGK